MKTATQLKTALATTFDFYTKAHFFHWNVTGPNFPQLHELFGDIYEEVYSSIDKFGEEIRALNEVAPFGLESMAELTTLDAIKGVPNSVEMIHQLMLDNTEVLKCLNKAYETAETEKEAGVCNFLADRIDAHKKHGWVLRVTTK